MRNLPNRPHRDPDEAFNRAADGALVEIWALRRTQRSRDRVVNGRVYFLALAAIDGEPVYLTTQRRETPEDAISGVLALFGRTATQHAETSEAAAAR